MKKIKIGVLGCADIAQKMIIPSLQAIEGFELVAVASRTKDKADEYAKQFHCEAVEGYEKLILRPDIQAVYIPLPNSLHFTWIREALRNGKHVIAEKPLATNFEEASELVELADRNRLILFENFMFKYHSQIAFARKKIQEGYIGEIRFFRSSFGFPPFKVGNNIRYKSELGGGALLDAGSYTIHGALLFLGSELEVEGARLTVHKEYCVDWWGSALLSTFDGILSQIAFSFDCYYQNTIEIWGSKGKLTLERAFTAPPGFSPKVIMEQQDYRKEIQLPADNQCVNTLMSFKAAIENSNYSLQYQDIMDQSRLLTAIRKKRQ